MDLPAQGLLLPEPWKEATKAGAKGTEKEAAATLEASPLLALVRCWGGRSMGSRPVLEPSKDELPTIPAWIHGNRSVGS